MRPLYYPYILAAGKIKKELVQIKLKGYCNNAIYVRIPLEGILVTKQEVFSQK